MHRFVPNPFSIRSRLIHLFMQKQWQCTGLRRKLFLLMSISDMFTNLGMTLAKPTAILEDISATISIMTLSSDGSRYRRIFLIQYVFAANLKRLNCIDATKVMTEFQLADHVGYDQAAAGGSDCLFARFPMRRWRQAFRYCTTMDLFCVFIFS